MRRLLIISPNFPPVNSPDSARVRASLRHYRDNGWEPRVLALMPDETAQSIEPALQTMFEDLAPIDRVSPWPLRSTKWFGLRNQGWRGWWRFRRAGDAIIAAWKPDLIFFSTTVFSAFYLGPYWRRKHGVPFCLDLQDPWFNDYYQRHPKQRPPGGLKYKFASAIARHGEAHVYPHADGFMSVSPHYFNDLARRFPEIDAPQLTLPFVPDERDFAWVRTHPSQVPATDLTPDGINLVAAGRGGPDMVPALRALRQALSALPQLKGKCHLDLIGTAYTNRDNPRPQYTVELADGEPSVSTREMPWRIGYLESLRWMIEATVNVILGSTDQRYSPSKIYNTVLAGRPVLVVAHKGSQLHQLIQCIPGCHLLNLESPLSRLDDLATFLENAVNSLDTHVDPVGLPSAESSTNQQCEFFAEIISHAQY